MPRDTNNAAAAAAAEPPADPPPTRPLELLPKLLPELTMAAMALAVALWPERVGPQVRGSLSFVCVVEVVFAMAQGTLTDIATRLRKRPPWWAVPLIAGIVVVANPEVVTMLRGAFAEGWKVFVPFLWSVLERLRELWTMPGAPRLEKVRRRALVSGRIALVLVFGGAATATAVITHLLNVPGGGFDLLGRTAGWWVAAAFTVAALDVVRVHRPAFARRPRALVPRFDALGVEYLEPLL